MHKIRQVLYECYPITESSCYSAHPPMLAAMIATTAIDSDGNQCLECEVPLELIERWKRLD